jgi:hypothetical protein
MLWTDCLDLIITPSRSIETWMEELRIANNMTARNTHDKTKLAPKTVAKVILDQKEESIPATQQRIEMRLQLHRKDDRSSDLQGTTGYWWTAGQIQRTLLR